jgi:GNAT superfamily N-acetyltransferase
MFESYIAEREGATLLKEEHGFGIYKSYSNEWGYLQDVYVLPEHRKAGVGKQIVARAVQLAKKSNKKALITTTDARANGATTSAISILKAGFEILKVEENAIWYIMEIK